MTFFAFSEPRISQCSSASLEPFLATNAWPLNWPLKLNVRVGPAFNVWPCSTGRHAVCSVAVPLASTRLPCLTTEKEIDPDSYFCPFRLALHFEPGLGVGALAAAALATTIRITMTAANAALPPVRIADTVTQEVSRGRRLS